MDAHPDEMIDPGAKLALRIKERIQDKGLSQIEVARHLQINQSSVSRIMSGQRRVTSLELALLAQLLETTVPALMGDPEPQIYIDYTQRILLTEDGVAEALDEASCDAALTGTGYIRLVRTEDNRITYERIDPTTVAVHD